MVWCNILRKFLVCVKNVLELYLVECLSSCQSHFRRFFCLLSMSPTLRPHPPPIISVPSSGRSRSAYYASCAPALSKQGFGATDYGNGMLRIPPPPVFKSHKPSSRLLSVYLTDTVNLNNFSKVNSVICAGFWRTVWRTTPRFSSTAEITRNFLEESRPLIGRKFSLL
jgi:hypothetical protein